MLLLFTSMLAFPDDREEAMNLERAGDATAARGLYMRWLDENSGHESAADVLLHAASLSESALEALGLLGAYAEKLDITARYEIYERMGDLESSLGLPSDAATHYEMASLRSGAASEMLQLEALALRFSMGEFELVFRKAAALARIAANPRVRDESSALAALSLALSGEIHQAFSAIRNLAGEKERQVSPLIWLAYRDIAVLAGDSGAARSAASRLGKEFPSSTVNYLATSRVKQWESPLILESIGADDSIGDSVQTGAFQGREGAASLRYRLEQDGFTAWIEESGGFWKVFVNDPDGQVRRRLENAGYESSFGG